MLSIVTNELILPLKPQIAVTAIWRMTPVEYHASKTLLWCQQLGAFGTRRNQKGLIVSEDVILDQEGDC